MLSYDILYGKVKGFVNNNLQILWNFYYLTLLQVVNLLLPIVVFPYLIKTIGVVNVGIIAFCQTAIIFLTIIISFGFNISATQQVAIYKSDKEKLGLIISATLIIKAILLIVCNLIFFTAAMNLQVFEGKINILLLFSGLCIYEALFPVWFFQGVENMKFITIFNTLAKAMSVICIFVFVNGSRDILLVPLFYTIGSVIAAIGGLYYMIKISGVRIVLPKPNIMKYYFSQAVPFFISSIFSQIYVNTNKIIVGVFLGFTDVAIYDLIEKVVRILKMPITLINQAVFPKVSRDKDIKFIVSVLLVVFVFGLVLYLMTYFFSEYIVSYLGNAELTTGVDYLRLLAIVVIVYSLGSVLSNQLLIPLGYKKKFTQIIVTTSILYMTLLFIVYILEIFSLTSIILVTLASEIFAVGLAMFHCLKKNLFKYEKYIT